MKLTVQHYNPERARVQDVGFMVWGSVLGFTGLRLQRLEKSRPKQDHVKAGNKAYDVAEMLR